MAQWAKPKIYWQTMLGSTGSTFVATSTLAGTAVNNIYNMLEGDRWEATDTTSPQYLTYDAGAGNTATMDYLAILGHNLGSTGAELSLEASNDNFTTTVVLDAYIPSADTVQLRELAYLANPDYEVWSGALPDGYDPINLSGTITKENTIVKSGLNAVKMVIVPGDNGLFAQRPDLKTGIAFWQGKTVSLGAWVYATVPTVVQLSIHDGVGESWGVAHSGGGSWEFLTVTRTISNTANQVRLGTVRTKPWPAGGTIYADKCIFKIASSVLSTDTNEPFDSANMTPFRYTRLKIGGTLTAAPYAAIAIWGNKTELDLATVSFDPYSQTAETVVNLSLGGYVTGVHERYVEREMVIKINDADLATYARLKTWWEASGRKNIFVAYDLANNPNDVFLMYPSKKFSNPFVTGGSYRDITLSLKGRRE